MSAGFIILVFLLILVAVLAIWILAAWIVAIYRHNRLVGVGLAVAVVTLVVILLLLTGCKTYEPPHPNDVVEVIQIERGQQASAVARAAREVNTLNPAPNKHTAVVDRDLGLVSDLLPSPTDAQMRVALERSMAALRDDHAALAARYNSARAMVEDLEARERKARIDAAKIAAEQSATRAAIIEQGRQISRVALGLLVAGALMSMPIPLPVLGGSNYRIGGTLAGLGFTLLFVARVLAQLPPWFFTVVAMVLIGLSVVVPVLMIWAWHTGLWQRPEEVA